MRRNTGGEGQAVPEASTKVAVWAHDVTGVPGAQYRYRLRAAVYNPLFQKHDRLIDELDAVAEMRGIRMQNAGHAAGWIRGLARVVRGCFRSPAPGPSSLASHV